MSLEVSTAYDNDIPVQLTEVQARILCVGADNGRTPFSSWNNAGEPPDLVRFNYPFESCGVELGNSSGGVSVEGEGQLIGPTSGWTQQFTSNTANDGKGVPADGSSLDLNTWVGYFNSLLDSDKYCAAFGVAPARTWRYMRVCTIDPCARFGIWTLKWLGATEAQVNSGNNLFYVGWPEELVEEEVIKRAYYDREEKNGDIVREWFVQELDEESGEFEWVPADQPTWQPSRTAEFVPIPNDCWIPCNEKFDDWRVEGAQSPCTYKTFDLCDFLEDGTQIELKLFLTDCDGSRTRELYTADQVLTTTDPLDPAVDQYLVQGELKNCDGSEFEEPPISTEICNDFVSLGKMWRVKVMGNPATKVEWWADPDGPMNGTGVDHDNVSNIFTNDGSTLNHVSGPADNSYIAPTFSVEGTNASDFISGMGLAGSSDSTGTDQGKLSAFFYLTKDAQLRDGGTRTGERGGLWVNKCCAGDLELLEERTTDTTSAERGVFNGTVIAAGIHYAEAAISDLSAWWNLTLEASFDCGETYGPLLGYDKKPQIECVPVIKCKDSGLLLHAVTGEVLNSDDLLCENPCAESSSSGGTDYSAEILEEIKCLKEMWEKDPLGDFIKAGA